MKCVYSRGNTPFIFQCLSMFEGNIKNMSHGFQEKNVFRKVATFLEHHVLLLKSASHSFEGNAPLTQKIASIAHDVWNLTSILFWQECGTCLRKPKFISFGKRQWVDIFFFVVVFFCVFMLWVFDVFVCMVSTNVNSISSRNGPRMDNNKPMLLQVLSSNHENIHKTSNKIQ